MWVCLDGKFVKSEKAKVSVFDHGFLYGDGVYDTLRTYGGKVWNIMDHLDRLEKSVKRMDLKMPCGKKKLSGLILELLKKNGFEESRIRITVTRGVNNYGFSGCKKPTLLIHAVPLKAEPKSVYMKGVDVITVHYERMAPEAKTISLLPLVLAHQEMDRQKAFEAVYVDCTGFVREGTITNVFIIKNGELVTPKNNILSGTTRLTILKLAKKVGLKAKTADFKIGDLRNADEVFITNAPRKIIPVKKVDGRKIGKGGAGEYTKKLMKAFDEHIQKNIGG